MAGLAAIAVPVGAASRSLLIWPTATLTATLGLLTVGSALIAWWVRQLRRQVEAVAQEERSHTALLRRQESAIEEARAEVAGARREDRRKVEEYQRELNDQRSQLAELGGTLSALLDESRQASKANARTTGAVDQLSDRLTAVIDKSAATVHHRLARDVYEKLEAHANLLALVTPRATMPPLGGWALNADVLLAVADLIWTRKPELVVECGSGSSSVWFGYLLDRIGSGRVVALEHDERFLLESRRRARLHGLDHVVEIRHAPLESWSDGDGDGSSYRWYARAAINDLDAIGLLLVDGPPADTGPAARYPAGPLLIPRCAADAVVVLDDTVRSDEKDISDRWLSQWPEFLRETPCRGSVHVLRRMAGQASAT